MSCFLKFIITGHTLSIVEFLYFVRGKRKKNKSFCYDYHLFFSLAMR